MPSFVGIYEQHVSRVYGYFAYALGSRREAEDLTQQTFEKALKAWWRYDDSRGGASSWLLAIARNVFVDHLRATNTPASVPIEEANLETMITTEDRPAVGPDPELERALGELSQRERELIALRFGGDLSGIEIARLTGLSAANAQQIIARALRRTRERLESFEDAPTEAVAR